MSKIIGTPIELSILYSDFAEKLKDKETDESKYVKIIEKEKKTEDQKEHIELHSIPLVFNTLSSSKFRKVQKRWPLFIMWRLQQSYNQTKKMKEDVRKKLSEEKQLEDDNEYIKNETGETKMTNPNPSALSSQVKNASQMGDVTRTDGEYPCKNTTGDNIECIPCCKRNGMGKASDKSDCHFIKRETYDIQNGKGGWNDNEGGRDEDEPVQRSLAQMEISRERYKTQEIYLYKNFPELFVNGEHWDISKKTNPENEASMRLYKNARDIVWEIKFAMLKDLNGEMYNGRRWNFKTFKRLVSNVLNYRNFWVYNYYRPKCIGGSSKMVPVLEDDGTSVLDDDGTPAMKPLPYCDSFCTNHYKRAKALKNIVDRFNNFSVGDKDYWLVFNNLKQVSGAQPTRNDREKLIQLTKPDARINQLQVSPIGHNDPNWAGGGTRKCRKTIKRKTRGKRKIRGKIKTRKHQKTNKRKNHIKRKTRRKKTK